MNPLGGFFEKFRRIASERDEIRHRFIKSAAVYGVSITEVDFIIKENKITIKGTAALKNTIFMLREKILNEFNKNAPKRIDSIN